MTEPEFYLVVYKIRQFHESKFTGDCVISESPAEFLRRNLDYIEENKKYMKGSHRIALSQWIKISITQI